MRFKAHYLHIRCRKIKTTATFHPDYPPAAVGAVRGYRIIGVSSLSALGK